MSVRKRLVYHGIYEMNFGFFEDRAPENVVTNRRDLAGDQPLKSPLIMVNLYHLPIKGG
jgi:hypothetical protein